MATRTMSRYTLAVTLYSYVNVMTESEDAAADKLALTFGELRLSKQGLLHLNAASGLQDKTHITRMACIPKAAQPACGPSSAAAYPRHAPSRCRGV